MKNHKCIHNYFKAHLLLLFLLFCSCLPNIPVAKIPDPLFNPSNDISLVFGRLEVIYNGKVIKPLPSKLLGPVSGPPAPSLIGIKKALTKEATKRFYTDFDFDFFVDYYVRVDRDDGYFIAILPPGTYYVEEFQTKIEGRETIKYFKNNIPYIINFDISPGIATYIGTIQFPLSTQEHYYYEKTSPVPNATRESFWGGVSYGLTGQTSNLYSGPYTETERIMVTKLICETKNLHCKKYITTNIEVWQIESDFNEARNIFNSLFSDIELTEGLGEIVKRTGDVPFMFK